jgi:SAM-dependent methyltransferase
VSAPRPLEAELLQASELILVRSARSVPGELSEARLQVLEACAARIGGFELKTFQRAFNVEPLLTPQRLVDLAGPVVAEIQKSGIHPALALSALSREVLTEADRKTTGAYHTDFRLARMLARVAVPGLTGSSKVIDPACGTGILLVALAIEVCGMDRKKLSSWLKQSVFAADLSQASLRGALLSLGALTDDVDALKVMYGHWVCGDSLLAPRSQWQLLSPDGFDAVIANPPWEKIKLTKHEFLKAAGTKRHYGSAVTGLQEADFTKRRQEVAGYSTQLLARYPSLANGEPDLYVAFIQLFSDICRPGGTLAFLSPGGLIRSQGTESVRRDLFQSSRKVSISIIDNRARFFGIDTRFKFLLMECVKVLDSTEKHEPIKLMHAKGTSDGLIPAGFASIARSALSKVRIDHSLPEVRSAAEWKIFQKTAGAGCAWNDPQWGWDAHIVREVDMTKERPYFLHHARTGALPVVEGRMVQHHRFGAKRFESGSGRKAIWRNLPLGQASLVPQFWIDPERIPSCNRERPTLLRAGFCDITGQTNERSLMASVIPPGVVCGNKVPTVTFPADPSEDRLLVWTAIVNSIPFDWMLRRVITTTVNYFLLKSIPLPKVAKGGLPWDRLVKSARSLRTLDSAHDIRGVQATSARLRATIDAEVAVAYGLQADDVRVMMDDFPLLDRGQPPLPGESRSTITRDMLLATLAKRRNRNADVWKLRLASAERLGALAYMPADSIGAGEDEALDREVANV